MIRLKTFEQHKANTKVINLGKIFIDLYENNTKIKESSIPVEIRNKFSSYQGKSVYAGNKKDIDINNINHWTSDEETAKAFSKKYNDGKVYKLSKGEFKKKFNFISIDIFADYLYENEIIQKYIDDKYVSESELFVLSKKINEDSDTFIITQYKDNCCKCFEDDICNSDCGCTCDFCKNPTTNEATILPKNEWLTSDMEHLSEETIIFMWNTYTSEYKRLGMDLSVENIRQFKSEYKAIMLVDVDDDPEPDAFIIYTKRSTGYKINLLWTDGGNEAKRFMVNKLTELLKKSGWWIEASLRIDDILKNANINWISEKEKISKLINKDFVYLSDGYYSRKLSLANKWITKRIYGNPII